MHEEGPDIVGIDTGADHPTPTGYRLDIRDLEYRLTQPGFGPVVINIAPRLLLLSHPGKLEKDGFLVTIEDLAGILPLQLWLGGMHDHSGLLVIDPEIVIVTKAHVPQRLFGQPLRLLDLEFALADLLLEILHGAMRRLHLLPHALPSIGQHAVIAIVEGGADEQGNT